MLETTSNSRSRKIAVSSAFWLMRTRAMAVTISMITAAAMLVLTEGKRAVM
jgi:hypothetical protein